jgi:phage head maturation protease
MKTKGIFYGSIVSFDKEKRTAEYKIMHYGIPNENGWTASAGSVDKFLERLKKANKGVSACYQHDEKVLIGKWNNFREENGAFIGTIYLSNTPFVNDTVLPQIEDGTLQGASPTIYPRDGYWDADIFTIIEGVIGEISLVGLPADLDADLIKFAANIDSLKNNNNFEVNLLTI